jgi:uncharacterized membrane protein
MDETCAKCGAPLQKAAAVKAAACSPKATSAYSFAWKALWPSFWMLLAIGLVVMVIDGAVGAISNYVVPFIGIVSIFVSYPLMYGQSYCYLRVARDGGVQFEEMFSGFKNYWNTIAAGLLTTLIVAGGLILLIVPGIIFACKLAFVPYLVVDRKLEPVEAIKTSWNMSNGYTGQVFLVGLLGLLLSIAGLICLGVGIIIAAMWVELALAALYYALSTSVENSAEQ